ALHMHASSGVWKYSYSWILHVRYSQTNLRGVPYLRWLFDQKMTKCQLSEQQLKCGTMKEVKIQVTKEGISIFVECAGNPSSVFTNRVDSDHANRPMPDLNHIAENVVNVPTLSLKETNYVEVREILEDVKINKATGYDLIPPRLVKESAEVLCYPLSTLINYILGNGKILQQWKSGEITPVYKKECELSKINYRPLTILPSLSKVFEKIVELRMSPHFEKIYHKYVFAYRKHHGCDTAILSLTEEWKKELDNHKVIGLVAMDLSKAFDTLPHDLTVQKLKQYGADQKTTTLITDYLSNRRQRVKLGTKVDQWYKENRMQRNLSKYQAIVMGKPKANLEFRCENTTIPNCEEMELLGVTMDNKLKFEKHVAKICRKVSQQTAVLKRMRNILPFEIRSNIYTCFIAPHFRYCSETWHFCNKITADKLEKVHERAICFVFKDRYAPYEELLAKLGLSTLRHERIKKNISKALSCYYRRSKFSFRAIMIDHNRSDVSDLATLQSTVNQLVFIINEALEQDGHLNNDHEFQGNSGTFVKRMEQNINKAPGGKKANITSLTKTKYYITGYKIQQKSKQCTSHIRTLFGGFVLVCTTFLFLWNMLAHPHSAYKPPSPLSNNKQGKCLLDICDIYDLDSLINKPTRVSENRSSCLDVILTNVPAFMGDSDVVETGLSNHYLKAFLEDLKTRNAMKERDRLKKKQTRKSEKVLEPIKPYINSRKIKSNSRIVIKDNEKIITDTKEVLEILNKYFSSDAYVPDSDHANGPMPDLNHIAENVVNVPTLSLKETNYVEVREILEDVKINKATGYDLIPPQLVKESAEVLCYPLSTLINYILGNGKIPQQWKSGEITPELSKINYRPLTILPSLSKVFEKIVELRMSPHFEKIYHKYVFAYRKHHGCDTAILSLTEEWKKELDNHKVIGLVAMDLSKAFDTLPHDSILGRLLFNIFMNDLAYVIKHSKLSAYADDTQISYADKDPAKVEEVVNSDLAKVDQWYKENRMQRNLSKYQAIVMGKPKANLEFRCENTTIPNCEEMELLGVTMDNKLKFEKHVAKICRKVSQQTAVLKRMRNILPFEIRSNIYTCFIAPHFRYCSETWHFCNKITADKLEKVNERAIRFVFKDRYAPYEELLAKLGLSTLRHERIKKIICNVYRSLNHSNYPASLKELLNLRQSKYSLRGKHILQIPKVNTTTYGLKSWRYQAAKLWNSLPDTARATENYEMFSNSISLNDIRILDNLQ
ncbi:RNA-directed DNA polymerase from mobile element jockey, partial [Paramuricea clavata]